VNGPTPQRRQFLRRHANGVAAVLSNGIAAASSFALQLVAARTLGATGLGRFSLLTSILITVAAVQSGWIGDSLTVLDRFAPSTRAALVRSQQGAFVLALVLGGIGAAVFRITGPGVALVFGVALALWLLEDTGRRLLMARKEFWKAVLNDGIYAAVALGALTVYLVTDHHVSLGTLVWSMAIGSGAACLAAAIQLPRQELARTPSGTSVDMAGLSAFAVWRAAQIGLRPASQFLMRALVAGSLSSAALGRLEAGRLLLAPVLVVINGAGLLLLPTYTDRLRRGTFSLASVRKAMLFLSGLALVAGAAALLSADWVGPLVTGGSFEVSRLAIVSWTLLMAGFGAGIPAGLALVAAEQPRQTFLVRTADSALGLVLALAVVALGEPDLAPAGLAVGAGIGAVWMFWKLRQLAPPAPVVR
jgi:O-antigen/teichoic acid export membrane protein